MHILYMMEQKEDSVWGDKCRERKGHGVLRMSEFGGRIRQGLGWVLGEQKEGEWGGYRRQRPVVSEASLPHGPGPHGLLC